MIIAPLTENIEKLQEILDAGGSSSEGTIETRTQALTAGDANAMLEHFNPVNVPGEGGVETRCPLTKKPNGKNGCVSINAGAQLGIRNVPISDVAAVANSGTSGVDGVIKDGVINSEDIQNFQDAAAKRDTVDGVLKKLLKRREADPRFGMKPGDTDKITKAMVNRFKNSALKGLAKHGLTAAEALGADEGGGALAAIKNDRNKALKDKINAAKPQSTNGGADPFNFDFAAAPQTGALMGMDDGPGEEMDGDMGIEDSDILKNPNGNIFKMLTIRYMKTAYPVFFEEGAIEPSETSVEKN